MVGSPAAEVLLGRHLLSDLGRLLPLCALLVCGVLPRFSAFPFDDVTPAMIDAIEVDTSYAYRGMPDVITGLEAIGRDDLLRAIRKQLAYRDAGRAKRELLRLKRRLSRWRGRPTG